MPYGWTDQWNVTLVSTHKIYGRCIIVIDLCTVPVYRRLHFMSQIMGQSWVSQDCAIDNPNVSTCYRKRMHENKEKLNFVFFWQHKKVITLVLVCTPDNKVLPIVCKYMFIWINQVIWIFECICLSCIMTEWAIIKESIC